jgi:hypothetical protein
MLLISAVLSGCTGAVVNDASTARLTGSAADPFDPASCSGPALTAQQADSYINPPAGIQDVKIGRFQTYRRARSIYPGWPAGPWQTTNLSDVSNTNGVNYRHFFADRYDGLARVPLQGEVHVDYDNSKPLLTLYGDPVNFVLTNIDPSVSFNMVDWDFTGTTLPLPIYQTSVNVTTDASSYTDSLPLTYGGNSLIFGSGNATSTCVRFAYDGNQNLTDSDNNPYVLESQLVVLGTFGN